MFMDDIYAVIQVRQKLQGASSPSVERGYYMFMILYPMPYFKGSIKYTPAHTVKYVLYVSVADKHTVCLTLFITHLSLFMHLHLLCQMKWSQAYIILSDLPTLTINWTSPLPSFFTYCKHAINNWTLETSLRHCFKSFPCNDSRTY